MSELKTVTKTSSQLKELVADIRKNPDNYDHRPFQILDNIYYVGNDWVGAYLIDTGAGLILLDANFDEVMHIFYRNVRKMGFKFSDIKWIFVSHGHWDHYDGVGEIQSMTDCETWFPEGDMFLVEERKDAPEFKIDHFYKYDEPIICGNVKITPKLTPGHTPGCTSLFIETEFNGQKVMIGSHGGLGQNGLTKKELAEKGWPLDMAQRYKASLEEIRDIPVDVFIPLHNAYYDIFSLADQDNGDHSVYLRPQDWKGIMDLRIKAIEKLMANDKDA